VSADPEIVHPVGLPELPDEIWGIVCNLLEYRKDRDSLSFTGKDLLRCVMSRSTRLVIRISHVGGLSDAKPYQLAALGHIKEVCFSNVDDDTTHYLQLMLQLLPTLEQLRISTKGVLKHLPEPLPQRLLILDCSGCEGLTRLPDHLPPTLQTLDCSGCKELSHLPEYLPATLQTLDCRECIRLTCLPERLPSTLRTLNCGRYTELTCLPEQLPITLRNLNCGSCIRLTRLPERLPPTLQILDCGGCTILTRLPERLPPTLQILDCGGCNGLTRLPEHLPLTLDSRGCMKLMVLPGHLKPTQ
jgi:Leucine-rich repeat (LRR) protein